MWPDAPFSNFRLSHCCRFLPMCISLLLLVIKYCDCFLSTTVCKSYIVGNVVDHLSFVNGPSSFSFHKFFKTFEFNRVRFSYVSYLKHLSWVSTSRWRVHRTFWVMNILQSKLRSFEFCISFENSLSWLKILVNVCHNISLSVSRFQSKHQKRNMAKVLKILRIISTVT